MIFNISNFLNIAFFNLVASGGLYLFTYYTTDYPTHVPVNSRDGHALLINIRYILKPVLLDLEMAGFKLQNLQSNKF